MNANLVSPVTLPQDGWPLLATELYTASTGHWTQAASMHNPSHLSLAAARLGNGDVLIHGDLSACHAAEFYDPVSNTWNTACERKGFARGRR